MFKKLTIIITLILLSTFNVNAGSDGDLKLVKDEPKQKIVLKV